MSFDQGHLPDSTLVSRAQVVEVHPGTCGIAPVIQPVPADLVHSRGQTVIHQIRDKPAARVVDAQRHLPRLHQIYLNLAARHNLLLQNLLKPQNPCSPVLAWMLLKDNLSVAKGGG